MRNASKTMCCQLDLENLLSQILRDRNIKPGLKRFAERVINDTQDIIDQERVLGELA